MYRWFQAMRDEDDGVLSFEWALLLTLLVIGVVAGLAAARDALVNEFSDAANSAVLIDQSYQLHPITVNGISTNGSSFTDDASFSAEGRTSNPDDQNTEFEGI